MSWPTSWAARSAQPGQPSTRAGSPYGSQIGQTGKTVKPAVYLAFGVSGAIQHKVGMQTAETIIAVNRDPDAPIGEFADLFVVADLGPIVPALAAALRGRLG